MNLTYIGHSCFKLEYKGYTVIFDPYEDGHVPGYADIREKADLVLCSHGHGDHNAADIIEKIGEGINRNPFTITEIASYHDDAQGTLRGNNVIRVLDDGEYRIAHFGDLGCELTEQQKEQLKDLDVALIPVGGFYTIDAPTAKKVIDSISPRITIPMHFRGNGFGYDVLGDAEEYLKLCDKVVRMPGSTVEITKKTPAGTILLTAQNLR